MSGKLFLVATPIGNLDDISFRTVKTLSEVDLILSEDTRETLKILNHLGIKKPQLSYRDENHYKVINKIIDFLKQGTKIALVSDRGTPLISDPGFKLVREALKEQIEVDSIPGPSALIDAIVLSGLPVDKFIFLGFLTKNVNQSVKILDSTKGIEASLILFENPQRVNAALEKVLEVLGDRDCCVCCELTKLNQKIFRGKISEIILQKLSYKGEVTIVVSKS